MPESLYPFTFNPKMSLMLSQVANSTQKSPPLSTPYSKLRALDDDDDDTWVRHLASLYILFQIFFLNKSFQPRSIMFGKVSVSERFLTVFLSPLKMGAVDITADISTPQREPAEREQQQPSSSERKGAHITIQPRIES